MDQWDLFALFVIALAILAYVKRETVKEICRQLFVIDNSFDLESDSRDVVQVLRENDKNYLVLYASQTGTAEDYAKKFAKELAAKFSLNVMCADLENYDCDNLNDLPDNVIVSFFISTYGEGDFPDGAAAFEDFTNSLDAGSLCNVRFTIFGLGNSTYEFFNGASKKCLKSLEGAGASLLGRSGEADDAMGTTDEDYLTWKEEILELLKDSLHLDEHEQEFVPSFKYQTLDSITDKVSLGEPSEHYVPGTLKTPHNAEGLQTGPFDLTYPYVAPIKNTKEMFTGKERNCIHSEFDISGSNMKYSTGDHLGVWPSNPDEKVEQFLKIFNLEPNTIFSLTPLDSTVKLPFPSPSTIGAAVRHYLEITGPISRQFFSSLIPFAPNSETRDRLTLLSKDKSAFHDQISSQYMNIADALEYLSQGSVPNWSSVPFNFIIESIPKLQPRYYSISSSASSEKHTIHITSVVENFPNPARPADGPHVVGVATNLLRNIQLAQNGVDVESSDLPVHYDLEGPRGLFSKYKLPVHVRRSTFRLPVNPSTPVIMIGPGTGVAPFRGFIRERVRFLETNTDNLKLGKHILFYGSRDTNDFLYKDEWPEYAKRLGDSFEMIVAHSRIPNQKKVYVQHKLAENSEKVLELINQGAFIYVCGDAKSMAHDVTQTLIKIISEGKGISESDASEAIKMLKTSGKFQEDVW